MFKRKIYDHLREWKDNSKGASAIMIEGARRVGKSTLAEEFAKAEYDDYILIDFSIANKALMDNFDNIGNIETFYRNLFVLTGKALKKRNGVIIFDEVQFFPKARQAIKHLVHDGRFDFIETGSLISIKKNVKDILIPSEEDNIKMYPMDFEEFLWATGNNAVIDAIRDAFENRRPLGDAIHMKILNEFRVYMAVGGMPQAVEAYVSGKNYKQIDGVKKGILRLYMNDLKKHDSDDGDRAEDVFRSIPSQLMNHNSIFRYSSIDEKARSRNLMNSIEFLNESMIVNNCVNVSAPEIAFELYSDPTKFKMFMGDTGLLVTQILNNGGDVDRMYRSLIIDDLGINLGMIFENMVAQMLRVSGHELYFHEFEYTPEGNTSSKKYEVDFLTVRGRRIVPIEVKSSGYKNHKSFDYFKEKYKLKMNERYIIYTKDLSFDEGVLFIPIYMTMCL
ncbi:MAG: ATP-binding protein [Lachnospiraceae bacterium]|nr:ATP-binding protein [Lachnospiraceae bacterium]